MSKVRVRIPASSANLGAGFDSLGLALGLYNTIEIEEIESGLQIFSEDGAAIPLGEKNLVYQTVRRVYQLCGKKIPGFNIRQKSPIPMARGLGSSSACIAGAITGANALLGEPLSLQEKLNLAAELEGHPDNVLPAMLGGFVAAVLEDGHVFYINRPVNGLLFGAFVPDFELLTETARAALPKQVLHREAVFNLSRAALAAAAFCTGEYDLLGAACGDRLHQPYRLPLIPGGEAVFELAGQCGALACFISGAGSTILAVAKAEDSAFFEKAQNALAEDKKLNHFTLKKLAPDLQGTVIF